MQKILIQKTLNAKIDDVFAHLADHGSYGDFRGVDSCVLIREGSEEKNGVGACRRLKIGAIKLDEDITAHESPNLLEYRIVKSSPLPIRHELGQIKLTAQGDQTYVEWTSLFTMPVPLIGDFFARQAKGQFAAGFASLLNQIEARCADHAA